MLKTARPDYRARHPQYNFLFNSYYNAVGERHCRPRRGLLLRPTVEETFAYRADIDGHMMELLQHDGVEQRESLASLIVLGLHHEQQHQELMLTDLKHVFASNPLRPAYLNVLKEELPEERQSRFWAFATGVVGCAALLLML